MKIIAFSIADQNNLPYFEKLKNSWNKFHPDIELKLFHPDPADPMFFYRACPSVARTLIKSYDCVIRLDADQIVTGDLSEAWNGEFDVATVLNSNPREFATMPVSVFDLDPMKYYNCGFVVMKNKAFVDKWYELCHSDHFGHYQYREQDILNLMTEFGGWKVKCLDNGDSFYGLASKGYTPLTKLVDGKIILPEKIADNWPDCDKQIKIYHWAGGNNNPQKGNYRTIFPEEVVKFIDKLIK